MKIALMAPAGAMHRYNGLFSKSLHYAPLTLTTLAALVPASLEAQIEIYDETVEFLPKEPDADLIGITVITGTSPRCYKWADYYRSLGKTVILGGVHPTLMPFEAKEHADCVIVGLAEQTWPEALMDYSQGKMKPYYYQSENASLAGRPQPRRDLLKKNKYITTNSVEATRGCIHTCNFCVTATLSQSSVLTRPIKEVIAEIEQLPGKEVVFVDPNLIANPSYAKELFREMIPLKRMWFGLVTVNIGKNKELFELMVKSGCRGILIGLEAVTAPALKSIDKGFNRVEEYEELIKRLHGAGISLNGTFVLGTDGDDKSVFKRTFEMIQKLKIDLPRYSIMTPFPGTPLYRSLEESGRIIDRNWANYDVEHCVIKPKQMSPEELETGLEWTWSQTYKHSSIFGRIGSLDKRLPINIAVNLGYRQYAVKFSKFPRSVMIDNSDVPIHEENNLHLSGHR